MSQPLSLFIRSDLSPKINFCPEYLTNKAMISSLIEEAITWLQLISPAEICAEVAAEISISENLAPAGISSSVQPVFQA